MLTNFQSTPRVPASHELLNFLLRAVCEKLELTATQKKEAENHYGAITRWLQEAPFGSPLHKVVIRLYPAGSLVLGTTNKPLGYTEFDLDLPTILYLPWFEVRHAGIAYDLLWSRLAENETYRAMMSQEGVCIRITYANFFHLDLIPAYPRDLYNDKDTFLKVPRKRKDGTFELLDRNPLGYAKWYEQQASKETIENRLQMDEASVQAVPIEWYGTDKPTLSLATQLLKRSRDIYFGSDEEGRKSCKSIVLTTLAAQFFDGRRDLYATVATILNAIEFHTRYIDKIHLRNPANESENLADGWKNRPERYKYFVEFLTFIKSKWHELQAPGFPDKSKLLGELFGETPAKAAMDDYLTRMDVGYRTKRVGLNKAGTLMSACGATPVPRHQFYGDE